MSASASSRRRGGVPREVHALPRSTRAAGGGWVVFAAVLWLLSVAAPAGRADVLAAADAPPPAPREFRAVWIASVANIDWPSRPGLSVGELRAEMKTLLDTAVAVGLNAVILQVRPAADALYHSPFEPWSEYLTGQQGKAPGWFYDPLNDWVAEAHARGLELHAWINPYRARHPSAKGPLAPEHLANQRPDVVRTYGDFLWMDPAEPAAACGAGSGWEAINNEAGASPATPPNGRGAGPTMAPPLAAAATPAPRLTCRCRSG